MSRRRTDSVVRGGARLQGAPPSPWRRISEWPQLKRLYYEDGEALTWSRDEGYNVGTVFNGDWYVQAPDDHSDDGWFLQLISPSHWLPLAPPPTVFRERKVQSASAPLKGARLADEDRENADQAARDADIRAMLDDLAAEFALAEVDHATKSLAMAAAAMRRDPEA